ncbi:MAG: ATP-binding cassette domain-containing protein [Fidelibacterota bacterium]
MLNIHIREAGYPIKGGFDGQRIAHILTEIHLSVSAGEIVALVGESGCGKSTLGMSLVGLIPHVRGQISLDEKPIDLGCATTGVRQIQYIFQDPMSALNPRMTIGQTFTEIMQQTGLQDGSARDMINLIELTDDVWYKYPHELSGGQCQRANIGRALLMRPLYLICDEIVSALDVSVQAKILNLLQKLVRRENLGILFTTHDLHVVQSFAQRVFIMKSGRILEEGETRKVFAAPSHHYTKDLLAAAYPLRTI